MIELVRNVNSSLHSLHILSINDCKMIDDLLMFEVAKSCKNLTTLDMTDCHLITDVSIIEIVMNCLVLDTIYIGGLHCNGITCICNNKQNSCNQCIAQSRSFSNFL